MGALTAGIALGALGAKILTDTLREKKPPKPPPIPTLEPPKAKMPDVGVQGERERRRAIGATGRTGTILTSPRGVTLPGDGQRKTLLGQ